MNLYAHQHSNQQYNFKIRFTVLIEVPLPQVLQYHMSLPLRCVTGQISQLAKDEPGYIRPNVHNHMEEKFCASMFHFPTGVNTRSMLKTELVTF
jgi:hypothetical protein